MARPHTKTRGWEVAFFGLLFAVYVGFFPYIGAINNPNENVRTYMTMALVEQGSFKIDSIVERHGWTNDMARAPDKKTGVFHLYSVKAPAVSYAGVPVYWAFTKVMPKLGRPVPTAASHPDEKAKWLADATWALRIFSVQIPCFAFLVVFASYLRRYTRDDVLLLSAVAALGLGTNYLAYALMFASHSLFGVAAFGAFALTLEARAKRPKERSAWLAFWAGSFAAWATLLEYHALPVSVCLALFALATFYRPKTLVALGLGALPHAAAMALFQWRAFGDPLMPGHRMSENQQFAHLLNQGYFGIQTPNLDHAGSLLFSRSYGLFGTSPFLVLGLLVVPFVVLSGRGGPRARARLRLGTLVWLATCGVLVLTVSAAINWRGGWTVGPRYFGALPPFLVYGAVCALERLGARSKRARVAVGALAAGTAIASVAQTGLVSLLCNSIPESVGRPLPELAWPLLRFGFFPRHLGDLVGATSTAFGYFVVACLVTATLTPLVVHRRADGAKSIVARLALSVVVTGLALMPALSAAGPEEGTDGGIAARSFFAEIWEPPGRDRLAKAKKTAETTGNPCAYLRLSELEESMALVARAAQSRARAGAGGARPESCR